MWQGAVKTLHDAKVPDARHDALALMAAVLHKKPLEVLADPEMVASEEQAAKYLAFVNRRALREPLQYILGSAFFMGFEFQVGPGVLIPRQDSETLCERAVKAAKTGGRALDLCCGSGCLGISLKLLRPDLEVALSDISDKALEVTEKNARRLGADVRLLQGDLFCPHQGQKYDLILSNPPYIAREEMESLDPEVRLEPELALLAGVDGLDFYRRILKGAGDHLNPGGILLLEIGSDQAEAVSALVKDGFSRPRIHFDLAGLPRVLETGLEGGVH
ncbi:MAG: peptide chain release factor N(5)-glutamine methyltransferase [Bacillota bacterium]|nr:peptide chain release factor N(5)-glutamine methyltransferase [Bacillota bacterium]